VNETIERLNREAFEELRLIELGDKPYLKPDQWRPVAYAARAPRRGATLGEGPLRTCFERNIVYLNEWWEKTDQWKNPIEEKNWWVSCLTASSEGRMLAAAAHTLRWEERADMRRIVETLLGLVKARQRADGYCLPYDESYMAAQDDPCFDERRNYDRVNLTRGMIAAADIGYADALSVMRRFYDWLYASPCCAKLLLGPWDATSAKHNDKNGRPGMGTAHNCNNGHEGSLLLYFSPVGKPEDLIAVERYFVQDFMLEACRKREPLCLSHYPLHVAHSYVFLAFKAWLDHYRATGAEKYIEAAKGAWDIVFRHFRHIGSSAAICETVWGTYPPDSRFIRWDEDHHTGENCGSVFWADINHRLLQFFPEEERYASEIEQTIFNCTLANQVATGHIRYHARLEDRKAAFTSMNTCCEVMGSPFIASLPQYIYSVADDGLYVNLFAPSAIEWNGVSLKQETQFPFAGGVRLQVVGVGKRWKMRVRVPGWVDAAVQFAVNGKTAGTGRPGTFVTIDRDWRNGDEVTFELPLKLRTEKYRGRDQVAGRERHALFYGAILMALVGTSDLDVPAGELPARLRPVEGKPLHWAVEGVYGAYYMPYWLIDKELFTCFPTLPMPR
jgi:hypothetical protein